MRDFKIGDIVEIKKSLKRIGKYKIKAFRTVSLTGKTYANTINIETKYMCSFYLDDLKHAINWERIEI